MGRHPAKIFWGLKLRCPLRCPPVLTCRLKHFYLHLCTQDPCCASLRALWAAERERKTMDKEKGLDMEVRGIGLLWGVLCNIERYALRCASDVQLHAICRCFLFVAFWAEGCVFCFLCLCGAQKQMHFFLNGCYESQKSYLPRKWQRFA